MIVAKVLKENMIESMRGNKGSVNECGYKRVWIKERKCILLSSLRKWAEVLLIERMKEEEEDEKAASYQVL